MKTATIIFSIAIMAPFISVAQLPEWSGIRSLGGYKEGCGKWVYDKEVISEWETIDTVDGGNPKSKERKWVEQEEWVSPTSTWTTLEYNPCGGNPSHTEYKRRVCTVTGIIQERTKTQRYVYEEPIRTEYQKAIKELKERAKKSNK